MIFSLDVRRARKGDCLLLHFGTKAKPGLVLIDGGPKAVYAPHLRPRLLEIRRARQLADQKPLAVDLMMVSHVDDDHIQGILDLTRELREAPGVPFLSIRRLWHNSFDEIIGQDPEELTASVKSRFGPAALEGSLPAEATVDVGDAEAQKAAVPTIQVLASIPQGHQLRLDAEALDVEPNPEFDGKLILAAKADIRLTNGPTFTVAGPMKPEVKALQKKHDEWLEDLEAKGLTPEEALAAYVDQSVPNLSSLVLLVALGGKSILLTGDARGDKILKGLELAGKLKAPSGKLHVDVLKVPHHGSANNLAADFFQRITADHYVFSGNGEHGNPERESLEMLLDARGGAPFTIHLTYPVAEIDTGRKKDWEKEQAKKKARKKKKPATKVRPNWSAGKHGLGSLFEQRPLAAGQALRVVPATKPHVLDLLDPLGF
jgi:hypothetical protein